MNRRNFFALTLGVATTALIVGCGGGGGKEAARTTPFTPRGSGGVRGFVFRAADGALSLGYTATAPAGSVPAAGATVAVGAISGVCGADGGFALDGIATGQATLKISGNGKSLDAPLTIVDAVSVQVGDPPFTRNQAIAAVKALLSAEGNLEGAEIFMPQQPIPASVVVAGALEEIEDDFVRNPLADSRWLVYADPSPDLRFGHTVSFYLIDPVTGAVTKESAESWPSLNRYSYYSSPNAWPVDTVQQLSPDPTRRLPQPSEELETALSRTHQIGNKSGKTFLLTVQGCNREDFDADSDNATQFISNKSFRGTIKDRIGPKDYGQHSIAIISGINDLFQEKINMIGQLTKPEDTLIIHITSHGIIDRETDSDYWVVYERAEFSSDPKDFYVKLLPGSLSLDLVNACHILMIVDTCYSGAWIDDIKNNLLSNCKGKQIAILTSADRKRQAGAVKIDTFQISLNLKNIKVNVGGLYSNGLLYALKNTAPTGDLYDVAQSIHSVAVDYVRQANLKQKQIFQNPQIWLRPVDDPAEPCPSGTQNISVK